MQAVAELIVEGSGLMQLQLNGKLGHLAGLDPGSLFVARTNQFTTIGLAATYGHDRAAVLFNMARYPDQPSPCLVAESALGGVALISLPEAMLVPALTRSAPVLINDRRLPRHAYVICGQLAFTGLA
jgi:hypothetical protein